MTGMGGKTGCTMTKFTIILDLDETLIKSWESINFVDELEIYSNVEVYKKFIYDNSSPVIYSIYSNNRYGNKEVRLWGIERPNLDIFMKFIHKYFQHIIVWSAGLPFYVEDLCRHIFKKNGYPCPKMIWTRENSEYYKDGAYHKPLSKIYDQNSFNIDYKKTFILDDKPYTFTNNPKNGILIPPYNPGNYLTPKLDDLLDRSDNNLVKLINWFSRDEVINSKDIRELEKSNIFI